MASDSVAQLLNGGCDGFAPTYMHWEEDLIIGGKWPLDAILVQLPFVKASSVS